MFKRIAAAFIDLLILAVLTIILSVVFNIGSQPHIRWDIGALSVGLLSNTQITWIVISTFYFTMLEHSGYTIGKVMFNISVVDKYNKKILLSKSLVRNMVKVLSILTFGSGFFVLFFNKRGLMLHDLIAETHVADVVSEEPAE